MKRLAGRRAVVTGAGRGLGLAVAELFVRELDNGAHSSCTGRRNSKERSLS